MLSKKIALMKLLEEIKSHSSKWMKTNDPILKDFSWQNGYGAFSVSPYNVEKVINYISRQHEHHDKQNFKDEFRGLLVKNEIEFDEKYVWD